jgi:DNA processing protein
VSRARACAECLRRAWLLTRLAGHLDVERERMSELLDRADEDLIEAVGGGHVAKVRAEWDTFDPDPYQERCDAVAVETVCRCDPAYPAKLWDLAGEPAVLHVSGGMERFLEIVAEDSVAIVGARRASPYALENARSLGRGLAGMTVISGMASGVDSAAHEGALHGRGATIAVLPSSPERAYPPSARGLHQQIIATGAVVSELGPGIPVRRWMFPARNRIIAALADMTVLVAGRQGSGAIGTALEADRLKRKVGAVPGQITAPLSFGPHLLLRFGAYLVAEPFDVLKAVFEDRPRLRPPGLDRPHDPSLIPLFDALADGYELPAAFTEAGLDAERGLATLADLEMGGWVRRQTGGRYTIAR